MCGVTGYLWRVRFDESEGKDTLSIITKTFFHRGPD